MNERDQRVILSILKEDIAKAVKDENEPPARFLGHIMYALSGVETEPPRDYLCPISLTLMDNPMVIASGETFERRNIEHWLFTLGKDTCPLTQLALPTKTIYQNR